MPKGHLEFARTAENTAADYLRSCGYKIIKQNYKTKLGEIDIVAQEKDTLVFVEVKARRSSAFGQPQTAVNRFKQRQISKVALLYLKENGLLENKARFDVLSIFYENETPRINLIRGAFELNSIYTY